MSEAAKLEVNARNGLIMNILQVTAKNDGNIFILTNNVVIIFQLHKITILPFTVREYFFSKYLF